MVAFAADVVPMTALQRDESRGAWIDFVQNARKEGAISRGDALTLRFGTALRWNRQAKDEPDGVTLGDQIAAVCETVAGACGIVCGPREGRDWAAFFAALLPFIQALLEILLPLIMGL